MPICVIPDVQWCWVRDRNDEETETLGDIHEIDNRNNCIVLLLSMVDTYMCPENGDSYVFPCLVWIIELMPASRPVGTCICSPTLLRYIKGLSLGMHACPLIDCGGGT